MSILKYNFVRLRIIPFLAYNLIRLITLTLRIRYINKEIVDNLLKEGKRIIFAFWHGRQFLLVNAHRKMNIVLMTSLSKDGELQTTILTKFGYKCVRGSTSKNAVAGLKGLVREIRDGMNSALAVDGPRGPKYEVKNGILFAAVMGNAVIIPVSSSAKPSFIFKKAWDEYLLPLPFSKAVIVYGMPLFVKKGDDFSSLSMELKKRLNELTLMCDEIVK